MRLESEEEYKYKLPPLNKETSGLFTKVICPSCQATVSAADININDKICKCSACDSIFSLDQSLDKLVKRTEDLKRPEGVDMSYYKDELDITLNQSESELLAIIFFIAALFAFLTGAIYFKKDVTALLYPTIALSMASIFSLFGLIKKGKTYITIDNHTLYIKHRPKYFIADKSYEVRDIDQIYLKSSADGVSLMMVIDGHEGEKHQKLIGKLRSLSKAKYLEQEIERHLGIENRKVAGEVQ